MPLPLTVSCFSKIQIGFTFLVPAHPGSLGKRAVKRVCLCVCSTALLPSLLACRIYCRTAVWQLPLNECVMLCTRLTASLHSCFLSWRHCVHLYLSQNSFFRLQHYTSLSKIWWHRERKCADTIACSLGWPFAVLKYKYIFQIKYTEAILSTSTRELLWFEITKMLIAVFKITLLCYFFIIFGWGNGGNVTSVGWQVILCDPICHVSSRSGEASR